MSIKYFRYAEGVNRFEYHNIAVSPLPIVEANDAPKKKIRRKRKNKVRVNNGFGKNQRHATVEGIKHRYERVYPCTSKTYLAKTHFLSDWLKLQGIVDVMNITQEIWEIYFTDLKRLIDKVGYKPSYAVSIMDASNCAIKCVQKNKKVNISPSSIAKRFCVRKTIPLSCDEEKMQLAIHELLEKGKYISALRIQSIDYAGLRRKETTMANARRMLNECNESLTKKGKMQCRIIEGAKGGRGRDNDKIKSLRDKKGRLRKQFDRIIYPDQELYELIKLMAESQGDRECLIPDKMSPKKFYNKVYNDWYPISKKYGLGTLHDIRAGYACRRYFEITGCRAPVITGCVLASKKVDKNARDIISQELGHGRIDVTAGYIGGMRAIKPIHKRKVSSHNQAFKQAFEFLSFRINVKDIKNLQIAERASNVIRIIYLEQKVGIFKIDYSNIQAYIRKNHTCISQRKYQELTITLSFLMEKLYKKTWIELLEKDLNNIIIK